MRAGMAVQEEIPTDARSVAKNQDNPKLSMNRGDDEQPNEQPQRTVERQSPIKNIKIADRNQRVNVQYRDGTIKRDVKYKLVEEDVVGGKAVLID
jgi:preprotein translocase subunit SecA